MYFVIDPTTGSKFGPVDVPTLRLWMSEGRISQGMIFEDSLSGLHSTAAEIPGLLFMSPPVNQPGGEYQPIPQAQYGYQNQNQNAETNNVVLWAFLPVALSLVCCPLFSVFGIFRSKQLIDMKHPSGKLAMGLNIAVIIISIVVFGMAFGSASFLD